MLVTAVKVVVVIAPGFLFAYLYGFNEHGFIPPAKHFQLRFLHHSGNYHIIMFAVSQRYP